MLIIFHPIVHSWFEFSNYLCYYILTHRFHDETHLVRGTFSYYSQFIITHCSAPLTQSIKPLVFLFLRLFIRVNFFSIWPRISFSYDLTLLYHNKNKWKSHHRWLFKILLWCFPKPHSFHRLLFLCKYFFF